MSCLILLLFAKRMLRIQVLVIGFFMFCGVFAYSQAEQSQAVRVVVDLQGNVTEKGDAPVNVLKARVKHVTNYANVEDREALRKQNTEVRTFVFQHEPSNKPVLHIQKVETRNRLADPQPRAEKAVRTVNLGGDVYSKDETVRKLPARIKVLKKQL